MYYGPGSAPMLAAATAWDELAAQLERYVAGCYSVLSALQGQTWSGAASIAMSNAMTPQATWATATAMQAEQSASQARAAAAAYETAYAATVPPTAIADNRLLLSILLATNYFGQNLPAIAATDTAYAEMWAQDAAAMYSYATASAAATTLSPFTWPPPFTNGSDQPAQSAAATRAASASKIEIQLAQSQLMSVVPHRLPTIAVGPIANSGASSRFPADAFSAMLRVFKDIDTLIVGPLQPLWSTTYAVFSTAQFVIGAQQAQLQAAKAAVQATTSGVAASPSATVRGLALARMGDAGSRGGLSVPASWPATSPLTGNASGSPSLSHTGFRDIPATSGSPTINTTGAMPMAGNGRRPPGRLVLRSGRHTFKMPRPVVGG
ncbi:PPE family protein [Mycobacterium basiliense]